jgi:hypothetical protein
MAFSSMVSRAAGYVVKAATDWNVIVANFAALWVGTTAGDTDYYDSSTSKTRVAIGGANTFMKAVGSVPTWSPLVAKRQGGSATVWGTPGTNTYTPTATLMQIGSIPISFSSSSGTFVAVTYPAAFTQAPAIFLSAECIYDLAYSWSFGYTQAASPTTGFNLNVKWTSAYTGTINFGWLAIGQ